MGDDPFGDLDTAMEEQDGDQDEAEEEPIPAEVAEESTQSEPATASTSTPTSDESSNLTDPAFEYSEVKQSPLYAREETWNQFEDAIDLEVVRALREAGVREEAKREIHDAALQVAAERPEEVAERVVDNRTGDR